MIADQDMLVVSVGYNGFARGVRDDEARYADRELKYKMVVHCDRNAILSARRAVVDCTMYTWPFPPCAPCAAMIIQAGIVRVVSVPCQPDKLERLRDDFAIAETMYRESGVMFDVIAPRRDPQPDGTRDVCQLYPPRDGTT